MRQKGNVLKDSTGGFDRVYTLHVVRNVGLWEGHMLRYCDLVLPMPRSRISREVIRYLGRHSTRGGDDYRMPATWGSARLEPCPSIITKSNLEMGATVFVLATKLKPYQKNHPSPPFT